VADGAGRHGEPVRLGRGVEPAEGGTAADASTPAPGVDDHVVDQAQVDHQPALGHRGAPVAVAAAADGDLEAYVLGVPQCGRDVVRPRAPHDDGGPSVDVAVPHRPRLVVPLVAR
jgi:hypothetical protein